MNLIKLIAIRRRGKCASSGPYAAIKNTSTYEALFNFSRHHCRRHSRLPTTALIICNSPQTTHDCLFFHYTYRRLSRYIGSV